MGPRAWLWGLVGPLFLGGMAWAQQEYATHDLTGLPPNINSAYGDKIDSLYYLIFGVTAAMFVLTEGGLVWFMIRYRGKPGGKAKYTHGDNRAELIWTVIPGLMLFGLAMLQSPAWTEIRTEFPEGPDVYKVQIMGQQFEWSMRYAGKDGRFGTPDDFVKINELHIPVGRKVVIQLTGKDVIHSLFIPHVRVKQDAVPGIVTKVWFEVDHLAVWDRKERRTLLVTPEQLRKMTVIVDPGSDYFYVDSKVLNRSGVREFFWKPYAEVREPVPMLKNGKLTKGTPSEARYFLHPIEIACAELCGLGHYRMRAKVFIHTEETLKAWYDREAEAKARKAAQGAPEPRSYDRWRRIWDRAYRRSNEEFNRQER